MNPDHEPTYVQRLIAWMVAHPGSAEFILIALIVGLLTVLFFDMFLNKKPQDDERPNYYRQPGRLRSGGH
ncbi:hypothetical protein [Spirosoma harenae]